MHGLSVLWRGEWFGKLTHPSDGRDAEETASANAEGADDEVASYVALLATAQEQEARISFLEELVDSLTSQVAELGEALKSGALSGADEESPSEEENIVGLTPSGDAPPVLAEGAGCESPASDADEPAAWFGNPGPALSFSVCLSLAP